MPGLSGIAKLMILPPFSLLFLALVGWLTMRRYRRLGRGILGGSLVVLYLFSTPLVGTLLLCSLQTYKALAPDQPLKGAEAIVVLGAAVRRDAPEYGGNSVHALTLERLLYAARLDRKSGLPILVTGGAPDPDQVAVAVAMSESLKQDFGISARWIESKARNTHENALFSARILRDAGITRAYLVTHAWHMPRAILAFQGMGVRFIPAPTGFVAPPMLEPTDFLATAEGLHESYIAIHELLGYVWYRLNYGP